MWLTHEVLENMIIVSLLYVYTVMLSCSMYIFTAYEYMYVYQIRYSDDRSLVPTPGMWGGMMLLPIRVLILRVLTTPLGLPAVLSQTSSRCHKSGGWDGFGQSYSGCGVSVKAKLYWGTIDRGELSFPLIVLFFFLLFPDASLRHASPRKSFVALNPQELLPPRSLWTLVALLQALTLCHVGARAFLETMFKKKKKKKSFLLLCIKRNI